MDFPPLWLQNTLLLAQFAIEAMVLAIIVFFALRGKAILSVASIIAYYFAASAFAEQYGVWDEALCSGPSVCATLMAHMGANGILIWLLHYFMLCAMIVGMTVAFLVRREANERTTRASSN